MLHLHPLLALALVALPAAAQSPATALHDQGGRVPDPLELLTPPTGIYCSCPPTNANSDSVLASVAQLPFVDGILVRVTWADLEPSPGVFDLSLLQRQFDLARQYDVDVTLALIGGSFGSPAWLADLGAQTLTITHPMGTGSVPLAWDPVFLQRWSDLVRVVGAAYDGHPRLRLVHATTASFNGMEMQLPLNAEAAFVAAGYTPALYTDAYTASLDVFAEAFPSHPIDVEVHPVFGDDAVAIEVVKYGHAQYGARFGVFGAWWSTHNATQVYPGMFTLLGQAAQLSYATVQVVGSWIKTPERFDHDLAKYLDTYALALESGVDYFEIWNADLLDAGLAPIWQRLEQALE